MTWRSSWTTRVFVAGFSVASFLAMAADAAAQCRLALVTVLPLSMVRGHATTRAVLNGVPVTMIVDTGAASTVVTQATADRLGIRGDDYGEATGIGGYVGVKTFFTRSFQIGRLGGTHLQLQVVGSNMPGEDASIGGLLGIDILKAYDVDLDLQGRTLSLFTLRHGCDRPAVAIAEPLYAAKLAPQPIRTRFDALGYGEDPRPAVKVQIGDHRLTALIDTGAPMTTMYRNAAARIGLDPGGLTADKHYVVHGIGPRGVDAVRHVFAPMTIGEVTVQNLRVDILDELSGDNRFDMLLGMDFFSRVHAWFSFSSGMLIMQIPPQPSAPRN
jgi:predicted aspartyl protease